MLAPQHRLRSTALFGQTIRNGRKKGSRTVVAHILVSCGRAEELPLPLQEGATAGPRLGLVVSKAVGNAVTRHNTSRKLRHAFRTVMEEGSLDFPAGTTVVLRALPKSATASFEELVGDVRSCIRRALPN
ncbi:ribonuclease P protein component [Corynebacterium jeikeium]|uniref:ribonuclease P protein component n=1 Tax=Corynebacterium jeikeium TaxID=38289 RepID=UPI000554D201|nr:ribonuclease P protein component [Corynebacterium jeikeium]